MSGPYGHTEGTLPGIEDLTSRPRDPEDLHTELRRALGADVPPRPRGGDLPDVTALRETIGGELAP